ncbi:hypothetical protein BaRGS_00032032 [Batillaria attramentaria]|uniref:Uncharacterized protein n=1 Tax=Batillaria attramentaria TaxID=370345 RepID=A0ABD0JPS1_9CAEN
MQLGRSCGDLGEPGFHGEQELSLTVGHLCLGTPKELHDFWREILPDFLDVVDPDNSGFLQELYAGELLTDTDFESMVTGNGRVPRKQKARKLWFILSSHTLNVFLSKIAPKLCERFSRIIPEKFFASSDQCCVTVTTEAQCFRHTIQSRVRLETMADLLCHNDCLSHSEYGAIITEAARKPADKWNIMFKSFRGASQQFKITLESQLKDLLHRYKVPCPESMADIMSRGFPCTCNEPEGIPPSTVMDTKQHVQFWLEKKLAAVNQASPDSSLTRVDLSSCSLSSSPKPVSQLDKTSSTSSSELDKRSSTSEDKQILNEDVTVDIPEDAEPGTSQESVTVSSDVCAVDMTGDANDKGRPSDRPEDAESTGQDADDSRVAETQALNDQPQASAKSDNSLRAKLHAFVEYYDDGFCSILRKGWQFMKMNVKHNQETTKQCWKKVFRCFKSRGCLTQMLKVLRRGVFLALLLSFICMVVLNGSGVSSYGLEQFWLSVLKISGGMVVLFILFGVLVLPIVLGKILFCMFVASFIAFGMKLLQKATLKAKPVNQETPTPERIPLQEL